MTSKHIITQSNETNNIAPLPVARKETALKFFNAIFPGDVPDLFMYIWRKDFKESISRPVTATGKEQLAIKAASLAQNTDIYFGLGLYEREIRKDKRIKVPDVAAIPGFWLDLDYLGGYHDKKNLPTVEQAWGLIKEFPFEPSVIVNSGGGLHIYWLFTKIWRFEDADARELAQRYAKLLQDGFIRRAIKRGFKLDNTADLVRVLRVPGTQNLKGLDPKYNGQATEVTLQVCRPDRRYSWNDIKAAIDAFTAGMEVEETTTGEEREARKGEADAKRILEKCPFLKHCKDDAASLSEPDWKAMIDVIAWCKNGRGMVHTLSRPYPSYSTKETDAKIENALKVKPRTCKDIAEKTGGEYCEGCKYWGKIRSPIALGMRREAVFHPVLLRGDSIEPREVEWLWYPWIPLGKLSIMLGDPSSGKTFLSIQICANVTRGLPFPGEDGVPRETNPRIPSNILYMSAEDDPADTLIPRFRAAGADMSKVHFLAGMKDEEDEEGVIAITLGHLKVLRQALIDVRPAIVVVDPVQGYMGADVDINRANEVRPVLAGIANLADEFRTAFLLIQHMCKGQQDRAIYKGLGSIDFGAAARSILLVGCDRNNPEQRALVHLKSSLAPKAASIGFTIGPQGFLWSGAMNLTEEDLLAPAQTPEERDALEEAKEFLKEILADGSKPEKIIAKEARARGISDATRRRAKRLLGIQSFKIGSVWNWSYSPPPAARAVNSEMGEEDDLPY